MTSRARLYNLTEAAAELRLHPNTIRRWVRSGRLPAIRVGPQGRFRVASTDLQEMVQVVEPEPEPVWVAEPGIRPRLGQAIHAYDPGADRCRLILVSRVVADPTLMSGRRNPGSPTPRLHLVEPRRTGREPRGYVSCPFNAAPRPAEAMGQGGRPPYRPGPSWHAVGHCTVGLRGTQAPPMPIPVGSGSPPEPGQVVHGFDHMNGTCQAALVVSVLGDTTDPTLRLNLLDTGTITALRHNGEPRKAILSGDPSGWGAPSWHRVADCPWER
jgi:excisionase family DNA binding protein